MSHYQYGCPWPSLATPPYSPLLPANRQSYIPYRHRTAVCRLELSRPAFARPCEGIHRGTSFISSSQLLHQCPACLVRLILIDFVMGGWWPYSCCFVGCCLQDLFNIARSIFEWLPSQKLIWHNVMAPTNMVMDYSSSIYTDSTWHLVRYRSSSLTVPEVHS